jgi:hypothetical protein
MCDVAFSGTADGMNFVTENTGEKAFNDVYDPTEVLDFVATSHGNAFEMLKWQLNGPMGLGCELNDEQIAVRLRNIQEFRKSAEDELGE